MASGRTNNAVYDYVVVGAGSAGCALADRLSAERDTSVLVLEAGPWDTNPWIRIPLGWGKIMQRRLFDWMYFTEPEEALGGLRLECSRGKVVGGSSSINAMAYVRGHRADYDRWADAGLHEWSYARVLRIFGVRSLGKVERACIAAATARSACGRRGMTIRSSTAILPRAPRWDTRSPVTTTARGKRASVACS